MLVPADTWRIAANAIDIVDEELLPSEVPRTVAFGSAVRLTFI